MKRNFTFLMAAFALMVCMMMPLGMRGQTRAVQELTNANIVAAGTGQNSYHEWTITDDNYHTWNAYAIKNQHSNATSSYHYIQIKKYASNTAYYIQVPELGNQITSITMTVSNTSKPMTGGGNSATLFFSSSNSTSSTGSDVASGTGDSSVTIDCSGLGLNTGYITSDGAVRIWNVEVTYTDGGTPSAVATPTFNPEAGTYTEAQSVTISCATSGATIHYTIDGSTPTASSPTYSGAISLSSTTTIKAIAVKTGWTDSEVATATYTINIPSYTVTFDPGNGSCTTTSETLPSGTAISLPTATPSATCANLGWTFAGWATESVSETTTAPTLLTGNYTISGDATLYAVYSFIDSDEIGNFDNTAGGDFKIYAAVGNTNYYAVGTGSKIESTITESEATVYTFEKQAGDGKYAIKTGSDYITYSSSTNLGTSTSPYTWTISNGTKGTWRLTSQTSGRAWIFREGSTDKFGGYATSNVSANGTEYYDLEIGGVATTTYATSPECLEKVATPTFSPAEGSYDTPQDVTISCTTDGATIYYTTDGTEPTTSSDVYVSPLAVTQITTVKAMAAKSGMSNSAVATATYNIIPVITISNVPTDSLDFSGDFGSFDYEITNPVEGATIRVSSETWINPYVYDNVVDFELGLNNGRGREGTITLSYVFNNTTLASASASIKQAHNPNPKGTELNPYTVAEACNATPSSGESEEVYVMGIVCEILEIEVVQYHNARYYITDDGSTNSPKLQSYRGRYIDNDDFMSGEELQLGDRVILKGKLTKYQNIDELAEGNYIVDLQRDVEPPLFSPESSTMTPDDAIVYIDCESYDAEIYYTADGNTPTQSESESCFLFGYEEIHLMDFVPENTPLPYTITLKAVAFMNGKQSALNDATYVIVDPETPGLEGNPMTVQQALDSLQEGTPINNVYVRGTVKQIKEIDLVHYYNATYYITDGTPDNSLLVYHGKYTGGTDFSSNYDLMVGDEVVVYGNLKKNAGNDNTPKADGFDAKNKIIQLTRTASFIAFYTDTIQLDHEAISDVVDVYFNRIAYNVSGISNPVVQLCDADGNAATYDWLHVSMHLDMATGKMTVSFQADENGGSNSRTAYWKMVGHDFSGNPIESNIVTVIQDFFNENGYIDELPFFYAGDTEAPNGISLKGIVPSGTDYLLFDYAHNDKGDAVVMKFQEPADSLTFYVKGKSFKSGYFKVLTSVNGFSWTDLDIYGNGTINNSSFQKKAYSLDPEVRFVKWIYTTKSQGNVVLKDINLFNYYDIVLTTPVEHGTIEANRTSAPKDAIVELTATPDEGYVFTEWTVVTAAGVAVPVANDNTFTMPASDVTVTGSFVSNDTEFQYAYSINGVMGDPAEVTVGETIQLSSGDDIVVNGQTFTFRGWTTDANDIVNLFSAGSSYTVLHDVTFYAVYYQTMYGTQADKHYAKVTREMPDWSGDYLIVYEDGGLAFNGGLETLDAVGNTISVNIVDGNITSTSDIDAAKFTIAASGNGYSIKSASGIYIGKTADSNGLDTGTEAYVNHISYNDNESAIDIVGAGGAYLRYNAASNQTRFRYYKSDTYTGQKAIQLYKYVGGMSNLYTRIFTNETASSVTIEGPSIIPSGEVLSASSIINDLGASRLVVDEGAQLVTNSDVAATIRKTIVPYEDADGKDNYYLIASPVDDLNPASANMTGDDFDLYAFDQSASGEEWQNYEADAFSTLESGKGYLYANNYGGFITMGGTMAATNNGVTITKVSGKSFAGWNLIGNPYPCNVTINKPFYRLAGEDLSTDATAESVAIAPMEGVFVYADGTETVSFTKAPDVSTVPTTGGRNLLSMNVRRNRGAKDSRVEGDHAIVRFGEGAMLRKLVLDPSLTQLYVTQDHIDYAIVNAEAEGELPVSFRAAENGTYTFSVAAEAVSFSYLHLVDNKTGVDTDLLHTPNYTFEASTGDYESRFTLVFVTKDGSSTGSDTFAFFNGSTWVVSNEGEATLQVIDMMGRVLSSQTVNGNAEVNVGQVAGVYVMRLINGNEIKSQKIIIK